MFDGFMPTARSLYIHVPFCARKCSYCAFYSEASSGELMDRYVNALRRELEALPCDWRPWTIFFGGGTPSILNLRQWETIFDAVHRLDLSDLVEWTVECNPATVSEEKAQRLRGAGVNRISMGVQSLDEALLERLGRVHTRKMVFESYDRLRRAGFENINLDLMFAIPGQSMALWDVTLDEIFAMESEHLSTYEVIYEEDTPLYEQLKAGRFEVDEDLAGAMYDRWAERAHENGFQQYEIANFARSTKSASEEDRRWPELACRHNVNYWRGGDYIGLGPSASGLAARSHFKNVSNVAVYCERLEKGLPALDYREDLRPLQRAGEMAAFGLRMPCGWEHDEFESRSGFELRRHWGEEMDGLKAEGHAMEDARGFRLTSRGLRFADYAGSLFLR